MSCAGARCFTLHSQPLFQAGVPGAAASLELETQHGQPASGSYPGRRYRVDEEAEAELMSWEGSLCHELQPAGGIVVCLAGRQRSGKSSLLNHLAESLQRGPAQSEAGTPSTESKEAARRTRQCFSVGHSHDPCTHGVWVCPTSAGVVLGDVEGTDSVTHPSQALFFSAAAVLLSDVFLYQSSTTLTRSTLDEFASIAVLAARVGGGSDAHLPKPALLWLVRDDHLDGTCQHVLEALRSLPDKVGQAVSEAFCSVDVATLPHPGQEQHGQHSYLQTTSQGYKQAVVDLADRLVRLRADSERRQWREDRGLGLDQSLAGLAGLVARFNAGGEVFRAVESIPPYSELLQEALAGRLLRQACHLYCTEMQGRLRAMTALGQLEGGTALWRAHEECVGLAEQYVQCQCHESPAVASATDSIASFSSDVCKELQSQLVRTERTVTARGEIVTRVVGGHLSNFVRQLATCRDVQQTHNRERALQDLSVCLAKRGATGCVDWAEAWAGRAGTAFVAVSVAEHLVARQQSACQEAMEALHRALTRALLDASARVEKLEASAAELAEATLERARAASRAQMSAMRRQLARTCAARQAETEARLGSLDSAIQQLEGRALGRYRAQAKALQQAVHILGRQEAAQLRMAHSLAATVRRLESMKYAMSVQANKVAQQLQRLHRQALQVTASLQQSVLDEGRATLQLVRAVTAQVEGRLRSCVQAQRLNRTGVLALIKTVLQQGELLREVASGATSRFQPTAKPRTEPTLRASAQQPAHETLETLQVMSRAIAFAMSTAEHALAVAEDSAQQSVAARGAAVETRESLRRAAIALRSRIDDVWHALQDTVVVLQPGV